MARLAIPVSGQLLYATGDLRLRVDIDLLVRSGSGGWMRHRFLVDTGTEIATFPAHEAKHLGLVLPARSAAVAHEQTGLEVRSGMLAFRIDGMGPTLYAVPCLFLGDPDAPLPRVRPQGGSLVSFSNRWHCSTFFDSQRTRARRPLERGTANW